MVTAHGLTRTRHAVVLIDEHRGRKWTTSHRGGHRFLTLRRPVATLAAIGDRRPRCAIRALATLTEGHKVWLLLGPCITTSQMQAA